MQNDAFEAMTSMGRPDVSDDVHVETPCFRQPITCNNPSVAEGQRSRFIGEVAPANDSTLQIEWLKDGEPVVIGKLKD